MLILESFIFATVLFGFLGIALKENLIMKILAMDVMSTGVVAFFVFISARGGVFTPIQISTEAAPPLAYADPIPQAVILTAIVIGFSIQALMLVGAMKLAKQCPDLSCQEIEKRLLP